MRKVLIVVDMQNDFINGSLGSDSAQAIVPNVIDKIQNFDGDILFTKDTHFSNYLNTLEGKNLPIPHCIEGTYGWELNEDLPTENKIVIQKYTFGDVVNLPHYLRGYTDLESIELVGLCTDICVVSNALILRANFPDTPITVDANCCAGTTLENHKAALQTMKSCQITVINDN